MMNFWQENKEYQISIDGFIFQLIQHNAFEKRETEKLPEKIFQAAFYKDTTYFLPFLAGFASTKASFNALPGLNLGTFVAGIVMGLRVCGFKP